MYTNKEKHETHIMCRCRTQYAKIGVMLEHAFIFKSPPCGGIHQSD